MSLPAVQVEGLSKQYRVGARALIRRTFRETLSDAAAAPLRRVFSRNGHRADVAALPQPAGGTIWALKDVSFAVEPGEVVGVIGRNGAGKSTLLKILSRITEPTDGYADVRGRVGSLLEVGTGFHPELTGRENIYLNGAVLGMKRAEIARKFDDIVAFAEIERFLDTPVKHYSSGMYMRLAFAVAAHLEPEILLVDEVLAVGDAAFQKKCLGKMDEVARQGRTVLFVSHQLDSIRRLCRRAVLLEGGRVAALGRTEDVVAQYVGNPESSAAEWLNDSPPVSAKGHLRGVRILGSDGRPRQAFARDDAVIIELTLQLGKPDRSWVVRCDLLRDGTVALRTSDFDTIPPGGERGWDEGLYRIRITVPPAVLNYGWYTVRPHFGIFDVESTFFPPDGLVSFEVHKETVCNNFVARLHPRAHSGAVYLNLQWDIEAVHD